MEKSIILIDDHALMRIGIKEWLSKKSSWKITYDFDSLEEVREKLEEISRIKITESNKYVVIVDLSFKSKITNGVSDKKGFDIIKLINKTNADIPCIVFSTYESAGFVQRAMSCEIGAKGYVTKSASEKVLLEAIETVGNGGTYVQQELIPSMLEIKDLYNAFTKKEQTVIDYISLGYYNEKIAELMGINIRTVENYISHVYDKTGTNGKIEMLEKLGLR